MGNAIYAAGLDLGDAAPTRALAVRPVLLSKRKREDVFNTLLAWVITTSKVRWRSLKMLL